MPRKSWTETDEKNLKRLLKKKQGLSVPDSSHDITFSIDLLRGKEGEELVKDALLKGEVKRDYGTGKTGNVYVEHESRGKESGVSTTESDYYIFLLSGDYYSDEIFIGIKTDRLKRILDSTNWTIRGGDAKSSKGKLVPITRLINKKYGT